MSSSSSPPSGCRVQAWVRAPDLAPNTIIKGDVRVKISAECPSLESASLGLRFKERSFVKAWRPGDNRTQLPSSSWRPSWKTVSRPTSYKDEIAYQDALNNKALWVVREEEKVVFESTQLINMGDQVGHRDGESVRDVVQAFAILVPSTDFPPGLDYASAPVLTGVNGQLIDVEAMYEYFVRVAFTDGTMQEISAGYTSFHPQYSSAEALKGPSEKHVELKTYDPFPTRFTESSPTTSYTAELRSASDFIYTQGCKDQFVEVVITRKGPARAFPEPLKIRGMLLSEASPKWAAEYGTTDATFHFLQRPSQILHSESMSLNFDLDPTLSSYDYPASQNSVVMPDATADQIDAGEIVTTRSAPVMLPLDLSGILIPNFEMSYQSIVNCLNITLETPRTEGELLDPDDPHAVKNNWASCIDFEEDEEEWVPWTKSKVQPGGVWKMYTGEVSLVVVPPKNDISQQSLEQAVISSGQGKRNPLSSVHYLTKGTRAPVFVDVHGVEEFLTKDPAERSLLAPFLEPVISSTPEGEEGIFRYFLPSIYRAPWERPKIYVGETWAKKKIHKDQHQS